MILTPEQIARAKIDSLLADAGWVLQDRDSFNKNAALGVTGCFGPPCLFPV